jgi:hypothetical protein
MSRKRGLARWEVVDAKADILKGLKAVLFPDPEDR